MTGTELAPFADILSHAAIWQVSGGSAVRA
jgi:hypothetical protein